MTTQDHDSTRESAEGSLGTPPGPTPPAGDAARELSAAERTVHAGAIATALLATLAGLARPERGGVDWIESGIGPVHVAEIEGLARDVVAALERIVTRALVAGDDVRDRALHGAVLAAYTFGEAVAADHVPGATRATGTLLAARYDWRTYALALEAYVRKQGATPIELLAQVAPVMMRLVGSGEMTREVRA